jgi:hypothetical protein
MSRCVFPWLYDTISRTKVLYDRCTNLYSTARKDSDMNNPEKTQLLLTQEAKEMDQDLREEQLSNIQGGTILTRSKSAADKLEGNTDAITEILQIVNKRRLVRTNSNNMLIGKQPTPSYVSQLTHHIPSPSNGSPTAAWEGSAKILPIHN